MLYRGIITFLIIIRAAPSAALRVLSFSWTISYRVGLSASIPLSTRIVLSAVRPLPLVVLPEVWYRRYLYGPHTLSLSLAALHARAHTYIYIYTLCFYFGSIPLIGVSNNFHLNYQVLVSNAYLIFKKHACSCPDLWIGDLGSNKEIRSNEIIKRNHNQKMNRASRGPIDDDAEADGGDLFRLVIA